MTLQQDKGFYGITIHLKLDLRKVAKLDEARVRMLKLKRGRLIERGELIEQAVDRYLSHYTIE